MNNYGTGGKSFDFWEMSDILFLQMSFGIARLGGIIMGNSEK